MVNDDDHGLPHSCQQDTTPSSKRHAATSLERSIETVLNTDDDDDDLQHDHASCLGSREGQEGISGPKVCPDASDGVLDLQAFACGNDEALADGRLSSGPDG